MKKSTTLATLFAAAFGVASGTASAACVNNSSNLASNSAQLTSAPFVLDITDSTINSCAGVSAKTAKDFFAAFETANTSKLFPGSNTTTDAIRVDGGFNSLLMSIGFAQNSPALTFSVPGLNINQTFNGATRDASGDLLEDYLKKNDVIGKIMNYQAKNSPFSPITGQGGLLPSTVANDFNSSFTSVATNIAAPMKTASEAIVNGTASNQIGVGVGVSTGKIKGLKTNAISLPLSYTFRNDLDPRRQLVLQLPITYSEVDGAKSIQGGLGVAYRFPMSDNWTLTPGVKYSGVASADLATIAGLYSATVASTYIMEMGSFDLAIGNMIGLYKTAKFKAGDYSFNPSISTTGFRNGVMLSQPVMLGGSKMSMEYSLIDTRYSGDKPFASNSQEIGVTVGTNKSAFSARSFIRGGISYVKAKDSNALNINFGYWF